MKPKKENMKTPQGLQQEQEGLEFSDSNDVIESTSRVYTKNKDINRDYHLSRPDPKFKSFQHENYMTAQLIKRIMLQYCETELEPPRLENETEANYKKRLEQHAHQNQEENKYITRQAEDIYQFMMSENDMINAQNRNREDNVLAKWNIFGAHANQFAEEQMQTEGIGGTILKHLGFGKKNKKLPDVKDEEN